MEQIEAMSVIVPSRGRPDSIVRLAKAFEETCVDSTCLHIVLDNDDPALEHYRSEFQSVTYRFCSLWVVVKGNPGIVHPLNTVANDIFKPEHGFYPTILGFMGDDHIPRTHGWDLAVETELSKMKTGIVYGDDRFQGENLPTAAFITSDIVQTLGFMAPRELNHLYVDNFWKDLGTDLGRLKYLPDVVIEHLHPLAGKGEWDQTYEDCNNPNATRDRIAYREYKRGTYRFDLKQVKALVK